MGKPLLNSDPLIIRLIGIVFFCLVFVVAGHWLCQRVRPACSLGAPYPFSLSFSPGAHEAISLILREQEPSKMTLSACTTWNKPASRCAWM